MPRPLRSELPDGFYHVTARGAGRARIFRDDEDRRHFLRLRAATADRFDWICFAVCLMTTHYHLVLETTCARLSRGIQRLNGLYAQEFNLRHARSGHVFGARFASWVVEDERHLHHASRYVLLNPVRAGLCRSDEDWPWSHSRFGRLAAKG